MKKLQAKNGFTIIELLIAMSLFVVVISLVSGVFVNALRTQRNIVALIAANGNAALALEQFMREVRTGKNFAVVNGNELDFVNAKDANVSYNSGTDANGIGFLARNGQRLTAENVDVKKLNFVKLDNPSYPPRITISLQVGTVNSPIKESVINLQTTVSARAF